MPLRQGAPKESRRLAAVLLGVLMFFKILSVQVCSEPMQSWGLGLGASST